MKKSIERNKSDSAVKRCPRIKLSIGIYGGEPLKKSKTNIVIFIWVSLGMAIILFFFLFSFCIGGSAMNGYREAGRYFVTSHENVSEVSETVWRVSQIAGVLFWVFIPLTPIGAFAISHISGHTERRKNRME